MGKKQIQEINWDEIRLYTNITFSTEDITLTFRNIRFEFIELMLKDRTELLKEVLYHNWYMYGIYDNVIVHGAVFKIVAKSKTKVEMIEVERGID